MARQRWLNRCSARGWREVTRAGQQLILPVLPVKAHPFAAGLNEWVIAHTPKGVEAYAKPLGLTMSTLGTHAPIFSSSGLPSAIFLRRCQSSGRKGIPSLQTTYRTICGSAKPCGAFHLGRTHIVALGIRQRRLLSSLVRFYSRLRVELDQNVLSLLRQRMFPSLTNGNSLPHRQHSAEVHGKLEG